MNELYPELKYKVLYSPAEFTFSNTYRAYLKYCYKMKQFYNVYQRSVSEAAVSNRWQQLVEIGQLISLLRHG
jgi:hypothetical protein